MMSLPLSREVVDQSIQQAGLRSLSKSSIREVVSLLSIVQLKTGVRFLRMDMGVPGIPTPQLGIENEIEAIKQGKTSVYGQIDGIPELKIEVSKFARNFLDIDVSEKSCIVTAGSMMGSMITFMVAAKREISRQGVLFIDPGFPVQKKQAKVLNLPVFTFDIYNYRGDKLYDKLEEICAKNGISVIVYSNPNNPTWICLTEYELEAIAKIADKHDVIVVEDLAYFGMDFRKDYGIPGEVPYQPTIAKFTPNYIILISSSKVFSYAGQRVGLMLVSDELYNREFDALLNIGENKKLGPSLVQDGVYVVTAGASHTAQFGLAGMLKGANSGSFKFLEHIKEYQVRARNIKKIFIRNGFSIVYDKDGDEELADGFYFTITFKDLDNEELMMRFFRCGLAVISLKIMGCVNKSGVRISVSMIDNELIKVLGERLNMFSHL